MLLLQILLTACVREENQNGIPFQVAALLLSHREPEQLDILLGFDLDPVIIFF